MWSTCEATLVVRRGRREPTMSGSRGGKRRAAVCVHVVRACVLARVCARAAGQYARMVRIGGRRSQAGRSVAASRCAGGGVSAAPWFLNSALRVLAAHGVGKHGSSSLVPI